jgi:hypothetical protein
MTDHTNFGKGVTYEDFVETIYRALLEAERRDGRIGHVKIEKRKKITSKSGTPAEIDLYWEYTIAGITHCVAIECRNHNTNVGISGVRDFARKISDISGLKGLMVTRKGFSKNAIQEAAADNIDLLVIRELEEADWEGRLKTVTLRLHVTLPSRITRIVPYPNREWADAQGYRPGDSFSLTGRNDQVVIEERQGQFKYSIKELEENRFLEANGPGNHSWSRKFVDGWIHTPERSIKIDALQIQYDNPKSIDMETAIHFEQYVLAVMEYVSGGSGKFVVLKTGKKQDF